MRTGPLAPLETVHQILGQQGHSESQQKTRRSLGQRNDQICVFHGHHQTALVSFCEEPRHLPAADRSTLSPFASGLQQDFMLDWMESASLPQLFPRQWLLTYSNATGIVENSLARVGSHHLHPRGSSMNLWGGVAARTSIRVGMPAVSEVSSSSFIKLDLACLL